MNKGKLLVASCVVSTCVFYSNTIAGPGSGAGIAKLGVAFSSNLEGEAPNSRDVLSSCPTRGTVTVTGDTFKRTFTIDASNVIIPAGSYTVTTTNRDFTCNGFSFTSSVSPTTFDVPEGSTGTYGISVSYKYKDVQAPEIMIDQDKVDYIRLRSNELNDQYVYSVGTKKLGFYTPGDRVGIRFNVCDTTKVDTSGFSLYMDGALVSSTPTVTNSSTLSSAVVAGRDCKEVSYALKLADTVSAGDHTYSVRVKDTNGNTSSVITTFPIHVLGVTRLNKFGFSSDIELLPTGDFVGVFESYPAVGLPESGIKSLTQSWVSPATDPDIDPNPSGLGEIAGPDKYGYVWAAAPETNEVIRFKPTDGTVTKYAMPTTTASMSAKVKPQVVYVDATSDQVVVAGSYDTDPTLAGTASARIYGTAFATINVTTGSVSTYMITKTTGTTESLYGGTIGDLAVTNGLAIASVCCQTNYKETDATKMHTSALATLNLSTGNVTIEKFEGAHLWGMSKTPTGTLYVANRAGSLLEYSPVTGTKSWISEVSGVSYVVKDALKQRIWSIGSFNGVNMFDIATKTNYPFPLGTALEPVPGTGVSTPGGAIPLEISGGSIVKPISLIVKPDGSVDVNVSIVNDLRYSGYVAPGTKGDPHFSILEINYP